MGIPDHLTCLLRNLYPGQEATVRIGHGTTDWFKLGKGVHQDCILSPCLFNLYSGYIMRNAGLDEARVGNKIAGRNINNLRYTDDTTLMAEIEEELKSLLMNVKEEIEKVCLKLNIRKQRSWHLVPSLHCKYLGELWKQWQILFWGAPKALKILTAAMKLKTLTPWGKCYDQPRQHVKKQRHITLPTKVCLVNAMVFPVVMYGYESWTIKKAEC